MLQLDRLRWIDRIHVSSHLVPAIATAFSIFLASVVVCDLSPPTFCHQPPWWKYPVGFLSGSTPRSHYRRKVQLLKVWVPPTLLLIARTYLANRSVISAVRHVYHVLFGFDSWGLTCHQLSQRKENGGYE